MAYPITKFNPSEYSGCGCQAYGDAVAAPATSSASDTAQIINEAAPGLTTLLYGTSATERAPAVQAKLDYAKKIRNLAPKGGAAWNLANVKVQQLQTQLDAINAQATEEKIARIATLATTGLALTAGVLVVGLLVKKYRTSSAGA